MRIFKRRHFLLLEVLIAFLFVASAMLPLLYPHFYIFQREKQFIKKIRTDIAINLFYADIIEQLQKNEISWHLIEEGHTFSIDEDFWRKKEFREEIPFTGEYRFEIPLKKKNKVFGLYRLKLILTIFSPRSNTQPENTEECPKNQTCSYIICASKIFKGEE
jgi:hypothetical protein